MSARRKKPSHAPVVMTVALLALAVVFSWWIFLRGDGVAKGKPPITLTALTAPPPQSTGGAPNTPPSTDTTKPENEKPAAPPEIRPPSPAELKPAAPSAASGDSAGRIQSLAAAGKHALTENNPVAARTSFNEALALGPVEPERSVVRRELAKLGEETVFSPRMYENDPLAARYVLQTGDTLAKVAVENKSTADLLAAVNNIQDKNLIRAGQTIKTLKGPFHAVVDKKSFTLDVYLGDTFVKQFQVGLGADDSTPNGKWKVSSKLVNPTYYPPRGGAIMAADDPKNPLGERWIGLTGIEGGAVGQERYGIHGTMEPDSIGKSSSLGCIRMRNEDVEFLYLCLVEKHSTVTVR